AHRADDARSLALPASRRVSALIKSPRSCDQLPTLAEEQVVGGFRPGMPLVRIIPDGNHTDRVQKHVVHGGCSLWRSAVSVCPAATGASPQGLIPSGNC